MMSYSPTPSRVPETLVVDANLVAKAILSSQDRVHIQDLFNSWYRSSLSICAPDILIPEAVSVIRRSAYENLITEAESYQAIADVFSLGLKLIPSDLNLAQAAFAWASRLGQAKVYDGFYLAVAEKLGSDMWTADEKLHNRSHQIGIQWVRWVGKE